MQDFEFNLRDPLLAELQLPAGTVRQVDNNSPAGMPRQAIVDEHHDTAAVLEIGHLDVRAVRNGVMRGGERVGIVALAARSLMMREAAGIAGGQAGLGACARRCHGSG